MSHKLSQTNELLEQLPPENRAAIVGLIDLKTESDMDKVLAKLDVMETKFDAKFDAIDNKFGAIDAKFQTIFWALGIIATAILGIAGKLFFM